MTLSRKSALAAAAMALAAPALVAAGVHGASPAAAAESNHITLYIFRGSEHIMGPDGRGHDAFVPSSFVAKAGEKMTVTVVNYDEGPHSITAPKLGLDVEIKPGKEVGKDVLPVSTTFSFTAAKPGVYRWYCKEPCDGGQQYWAMSSGYGGPGKEGFMSGNIVVLANK